MVSQTDGGEERCHDKPVATMVRKCHLTLAFSLARIFHRWPNSAPFTGGDRHRVETHNTIHRNDLARRQSPPVSSLTLARCRRCAGWA